MSPTEPTVNTSGWITTYVLMLQTRAAVQQLPPSRPLQPRLRQAPAVRPRPSCLAQSPTALSIITLWMATRVNRLKQPTISPLLRYATMTIHINLNTDFLQFSTWNPYVSDGSDCQHLWLDNYVCVEAPDQPTTTTAASTTTRSASNTTPSPLIPSTDANCAKYHYVVDGDDCEAIESEYSITKTQVSFYNSHA